MTDRAVTQSPAVAPFPAATSSHDGQPGTHAPYVPGFVDRQLDRLIAFLDGAMPGLPALGLALCLAVAAGFICGMNFMPDDVTYPMDMDASGITVELPQPSEAAASTVAAKPSPSGEVSDTRARARVR